MINNESKLSDFRNIYDLTIQMSNNQVTFFFFFLAPPWVSDNAFVIALLLMLIWVCFL